MRQFGGFSDFGAPAMEGNNLNSKNLYSNPWGANSAPDPFGEFTTSSGNNDGGGKKVDVFIF